MPRCLLYAINSFVDGIAFATIEEYLEVYSAISGIALETLKNNYKNTS